MRYPSDTLSPRPLPRNMGYSRESPIPSMTQDRDKIMTERGLPLERGVPPERMDRLDRGMPPDRMQERGLPLERSPIPSTSPSMLKRDRSPPLMQNSMGSKSQFSGQSRPVYSSYSNSGVNNMSNSNYNIPNSYDRKVGYNSVIDSPMQHQPNYQQNMGLLNLPSISSLPPNLQMQLIQAQLMRSSPNLFPAGQPIPISGRGSGLPLQPTTHRPNPKMWNGTSQNKKW